MPSKVCEVASYRHYENLYDWSILIFPVLLKDITKFEKANNISVNVYGCTNYDDKVCKELLEELACSSDEDDEKGWRETKKEDK